MVGLVAKNGILIVEFANQLQESGLTKRNAAIESAKTRLRPVLMTSAGTMLGHLPLVFVTGAGAQARNSIGIVLVAGMGIGTFFTLFVVPALYYLIAARHQHESDHDVENLLADKKGVSTAQLANDNSAVDLSLVSSSH